MEEVLIRRYHELDRVEIRRKPLLSLRVSMISLAGGNRVRRRVSFFEHNLRYDRRHQGSNRRGDESV